MLRNWGNRLEIQKNGTATGGRRRAGRAGIGGHSGAPSSISAAPNPLSRVSSSSLQRTQKPWGGMTCPGGGTDGGMESQGAGATVITRTLIRNTARRNETSIRPWRGASAKLEAQPRGFPSRRPRERCTLTREGT